MLFFQLGWWQWLLSPVILGAIAYGTLCLLLYGVQTRFIFFPSPHLQATPARYQLPYQDVWLSIPTEANATGQVHGWWVPTAHPTPLGTLLYLHGNGGNISVHLDQVQALQRLGFSTLLIDYRGYGHSVGGFPSEAKVYADAEAAWQYLVQTRRIPPAQIVILGQSLGGAVAIDLATHHPDAGGLIVESSFTSIPAMVQRTRWLRWFPIQWLLTQRFNSLQKVKTLQVPTLYLHGSADQLIPAHMSQTLFAATPEPKQLALFEQAGHNDLFEVAGPQYLDTVQAFVHRVITPYQSTELDQ